MDEFNPFTLKDKTILVTGGSSGIGRGIAIDCSKAGAKVIIIGRNETRLQETLQSMSGEGHQYIIGDLTKTEDIDNVVNQLPKLNGVVHWAGIGHRKMCKQIVEEDVDTVMNINFKAPVLLQSSLLANKKIQASSSIVFIASRAAESPSIGNAVYSASKGAIISYSKCLAIELAPRQIRVNCICPAMVWTDLILQGTATKEDLEQEQLKYPLKRYGQPEDIANLAIYLLSDASTWMTNSCINLTGGGGRIVYDLQFIRLPGIPADSIYPVLVALQTWKERPEHCDFGIERLLLWLLELEVPRFASWHNGSHIRYWILYRKRDTCQIQEESLAVA